MTKKLITTLFIFLGMLSISFAENTAPLTGNQAFQMSATARDYQTILVKWNIAPGYYLYQKKFSFHLIKPKNTQLAEPLMPGGDKSLTTSLGTFKVYDNQLIISLPIIDSTEKNILLQVHYQGCSHNGYCYPPTNKVVSVNLAGDYMQWQSPLNIDVAPIKKIMQIPKESLTDPLSTLLQKNNLLLLLLGFLGFGILVSLTPCVLPMIPILSSMILGKEKMTHTHAFLLSLFYVLGMAATYAIAGVLFGFVGSSIQVIFQKPWIITAFSLLFVLMALSLFGFFQIQLPEKLRGIIASTSNHQKNGTYLGALAMGCLSTLILSPCVTPPLVAVLGFISQTGNMALGGAALFTMGIGMGFPLLLIGAFGSRVLPHTGAWMNTIKNLMGILMIAVAILMIQRITPAYITMLLWGILVIGTSLYLGALSSVNNKNEWLKKCVGILFFAYGILIFYAAYQGQTNPLAVIQKPSQLEKHALNFKVIHGLKQAKKIIKNTNPNEIVMIDFYADWCIACQELDTNTFNRPDVQSALRNFVLIRADITQNNIIEQELMAHFNVIAPPTILFFKNGQEIKNSRIIGFINKKTFIQKISTLT